MLYRNRVPGTAVIEGLMRVRPAQLAAFLKSVLAISRTEILAATGCRYWVDPVSNLGLALIKEGVYESSLTSFVHSTLRDGDVFVDLGANEGYFSILAGTLVGSGRVVAIEPQSRLQSVVRRNAALNGLTNITLAPVAVADGVAEVDMLLRPTTNSGASSIFRHWKLGWARERVHATTLDRIFADYSLADVRVLKVDCEGAEILAFEAADSILRAGAVQYIVMEYHPQIVGLEQCRAVHGRISGHGYRLAGVRGLNVYCSPGTQPPPGAEMRPPDYQLN